MRIIVGVTGSSGAIFAKEFLRQCEAEKFLIISKWGKVVVKEELGISEKEFASFAKRQFSDDDLTAPSASGSNRFDAMVILPCSTSTVGKIASGIGDTLITRTAQVALKERYRLILCIRETPLSTITLEQCTKISACGGMIMPISPPLYFVPNSVQEYIDAYIAKLLGVLGLRESKGWRSGDLE
jgi:4-hydroxy-3-polyprenylbenzoate decarboxylase